MVIMNYNRQKLREKMIELIMNAVIADASGKDKDTVEGRPSQIFFIGNLSTKPRSGELQKVATKMSPNSIGLEILLPLDMPEDAILKVSPAGAFYYRVFPKYEEQKAYSDKLLSKKSKSINFIEKFRKIKFVTSFQISARDAIKQCEENGEINVQFCDFCRNLWEQTKQDKLFFAPVLYGGKAPTVNVPIETIKEKAEYEKFIESKKSDVKCRWGFEIIIKCFKTLAGYRVLILFVNNMEAEEERKMRKIVENYIFESNMHIKSSIPLKSFDLDQLEKNYKHDRKVEASGINCSFDKLSECEIETNYIPIFRQTRRVPRNMGHIKFSDMQNNPIPALDSLKTSMKASYADFIKKYEKQAKTETEKEEFEKDAKLVSDEIERFSNGIEQLKKYEDALRAFRLMNKAFSMTGKFDSWHPFQIVFITSLVPDIIAERHPEIKNSREKVDLLYFPTGGGKTEAFLGLAVFQAFYDRISGKKFGVSIITKFPLRMLSLDQMRRIAEIFAKAEMVRRQEKDIGTKDYHPFSVGYFVGEKITPNKLVKYDDQNRQYKSLLDELDGEKLEKYHILSICPFCGDDVKISKDRERQRLTHICANKNCIGELPIYISDVEIFRYVPTFIVGTLDKMASIGLQINFRNMLGAISHECEIHGFSSSSTCTERELCKAELKELPQYDYSPSLLIQDEMHLVRETLGSFDSHYETLISHMISKFSGKGKKIKIVGATATLSDSTYNEHVNHLYLRNAIKFPAALETFTQDSGDIARVIVGIMPHSKSLINSMEDIITSISAIVQKWIGNSAILSRNMGGEYPEDAIKKELRDFWTILSYHVKKNDAYQLDRSVSTRINEMLQNDMKLKRLKRKSLTGDINFKEIKEVMNRVKDENSYENILDLIIATSIISHGVDIDVLNLMTFMGMPGNNAEYIQALSRVGRRSPGLVFAVFNPTRERDRSYFKYFKKFHQVSDLLIEPAPIQRWSKKVLEKTCSGVFCAAVYSYFDFITRKMRKENNIDKLIFPKNFKEAMKKGIIIDSDIIDFVKECYTEGNVASLADFVEKTKILSSQCIDSILKLDINAIRPYDILGNFLAPQPLKNLRDVEEGAFVALNEKSAAIISRGTITEAEFTEEE